MNMSVQMRLERKDFTVKVRFVELVLRPEGHGWIAHVPALPGVRSQGEDVLEAFANVEDALRGAVASYRDDGIAVPWVDDYFPETQEHRSKWVRVDG